MSQNVLTPNVSPIVFNTKTSIYGTSTPETTHSAFKSVTPITQRKLKFEEHNKSMENDPNHLSIVAINNLSTILELAHSMDRSYFDSPSKLTSNNLSRLSSSSTSSSPMKSPQLPELDHSLLGSDSDDSQDEGSSHLNAVQDQLADMISDLNETTQQLDTALAERDNYSLDKRSLQKQLNLLKANHLN